MTHILDGTDLEDGSVEELAPPSLKATELPPRDHYLTPTEDRLLTALSEEAWPRLTKLYAPNNCVMGTRFVIEAMAEIGTHVRPLVVTVAAYNPAAVARMTKEGRGPSSEEEFGKWYEEDGAFARGVIHSGKAPAPGDDTWDGHLIGVGLSRTGRYFLYDLTAPQLNYPQEDIVGIEPNIAPVHVGWADEAEPASFLTTSGVMISYQPVPGAKDYLQFVAWSEPMDPFSPVSAIGIDMKRKARELA